MSPKHTPTPVGQRIVTLRNRRGWTQLKLSHESGLALNTITRLETGAVQDPPLSTLATLANTFGVEVAELLAPPSTEAAASEVAAS